MEAQACHGCQVLAGRLAELEAQRERQRQKIERQEMTIMQLQQQVRALREQVEELHRQNKRQAAPFSKGPPKPKPKRPGRKPGDAYGMKAFRAAPAPGRISETYQVPLPACCPHCGSDQLQQTDTATQFQVELPQQPIYRRFVIAVGACQRCQRRVQGRHPLQTSDALGAARSQLGPRLQGFLAVLQKQLGLSYGKCVELLQKVWKIRLTRGSVVHVLRRLAKRLAPAAERIRQAIRASPQAAVDETGWRIGGRSAWLHVQAIPRAVSYVIDPARSAAVSARVLGWDYAGVLGHDGFRSYDGFRQARHQQCLGHVLRRCHDLLQQTTAAAAVFVRAVKNWFQKALAQRDRVRAGEWPSRYLDVWATLHEQELQELLRTPKRNPDNVRLAGFLRRNLSAWLTFLKVPDVDATTWRAEQALRPAVVNRKVWGGNRTAVGAGVQSTLMTVLGTLERQAFPLIETLARALCGGSVRFRWAG